MIYLYLAGSALFVFIFLIGMRVIRPTQRGLVEHLGRYNRFAEPGFHWIIPGIESMIYVDITENMVESGKRQMITNDNLNATIDALIFYKVKSDEPSCKAAEYNVKGYRDQIIALTKTALRNIIGTMTLKQANSERNKINNDLLSLLSKETGSWGIEVVRAELKEIDPPEDVQATMNQIVKASNEKTAAVDFATALETKADGEKRGAIKRAEGSRQAAILEAEGIKQATVLEAEGKSDAIKLVNEATEKTLTDKALSLRKVEAFERAFANNVKIVVPNTGSLINMVDGLVK